MPRKSKSRNKGKNKTATDFTEQNHKTEKKPGKQEKPKFKFTCQLCGKCCGDEEIFITITDLERWVTDNTIYRVMHLLKFKEMGENTRIILKKDNDGKCNLYHRDNKQCTIYESRPLFCRAYPLGFNGTDYYLKSTNCKGLNKGKMTMDDLKRMRDDAFDEHIAARQLERVLPVIYGIIFNKLIEDSQALMEKMSNSKDNGVTQGNNNDEKK